MARQTFLFYRPPPNLKPPSAIAPPLGGRGNPFVFSTGYALFGAVSRTSLPRNLSTAGEPFSPNPVSCSTTVQPSDNELITAACTACVSNLPVLFHRQHRQS